MLQRSIQEFKFISDWKVPEYMYLTFFLSVSVSQGNGYMKYQEKFMVLSKYNGNIVTMLDICHMSNRYLDICTNGIYLPWMCAGFAVISLHRESGHTPWFQPLPGSSWTLSIDSKGILIYLLLEYLLYCCY